MEYPVEKYVDIITTCCEGGLQLWINDSQCNILTGAHQDWISYNEFREEFIRVFKPTMDTELAHQ